MKIIELEIPRQQAFETLRPLLAGGIFHMTSWENAIAIQREGIIRGDFSLPCVHPQSKYSYGRKRNYVCLFDLRKDGSDNSDATRKLNFYNPDYIDSPVYFLLNQSLYSSLIFWKSALKEVDSSETYIPHLECWSQGDIEIMNCDIMVAVKFQRESDIKNMTIDELKESLKEINKVLKSRENR